MLEALASCSYKILVWELSYIFACLPASFIPDELHVDTYFQAQARAVEGIERIKQVNGLL